MNKEIALQNLIDLDIILRKNNSEYWLCCGTLLGFYRNNDFISHDTDTDICVNIDNLSAELLDGITKAKFSILKTYGRLVDGFEIALMRGGVKTDIFFFYKTDKYWYHSVYANMNINGFQKFDYIFKPFGLKEVIFKNHLFFAPENIEEVLCQQYGEDWQTPNKSWSYYKSPKNIVETNIRTKEQDSFKDFQKILNK